MRSGSRRLLLSVSVTVALLLAAIGGLAAFGTDPGEPAGREADTDSRIPAGASSLAAVHDAGITGENVTVGVIDVTGFDTDHPAVADNVAAARSFAPGEGVGNGGQASHGTAAASLVTRTAPDSRLYLATFDTVDGFRSAVDWLLRAEVDVIVAPVTFYGQFDARESAVRAATAKATEQGITVVAPVGNLGRGHWEGRYRPVDGVHHFEGGPRNRIAVQNESTLRLWFSWDRSHRDEDYTAELYWTNGTASRLVARSRPYPGDDAPNERLVTRLPPGRYFVRITGPANATGARLQLESPTHDLGARARAGSITAPATAPGVLTVGAYDPDTGRVRPFSSAGPTRDGRIGVDLVAPDGYPAATKPDGFVGSSAAAPYVAGVVALLLEADGDLTPREIELLLEGSTDDLRRSGADPVSGHGLVRPVDAVRTAQDRTRTIANRSNRD